MVVLALLAQHFLDHDASVPYTMNEIMPSLLIAYCSE